MKELQDIMNDIAEWSDKTFGYGQRNPAIIYHLKKEVDELITAYNDVDTNNATTNKAFGKQVRKITMEYADCFMLLFDSAHHFGFTAEEVINIMREKLEINKKRKWGKPDQNGVIEHIK